jgi:hypothetical protein
MNIKKLGVFLLITAAFMMVTPVCADVATFDSVSSPETAMVGEVVTVDVVISYDFDQLTLLSPGVYYLVEDDYMVEEFIEVTGSGTEAVSLSFNAPNVPGEYVFIVDLYYQEGEDWYNAGQENYYITLTVDGGGSVGAWSASVVKIRNAQLVAPGGSVDIKVYVDYDFPISTNMEIAISDPVTGEAIDVVSAVLDGKGSDDYDFIITAPNEVGTYELGADVIFETDQGWEFSEDAVMTFTFEVDDQASSGGIPGFPVASAILGALMVIGFLQYSGRKAPLF